MIFTGVTCKIIEDLLPLYADGICSEDSRDVIGQHIAICPDCKEKLDAMTAELEKNVKETDIKNPFRKIRFHYMKLAAATLLICALIIAPACGIWYLKTNEIYDQGYSWATMTTNGKLRKIGNLFKKGSYREALELFEPYYEKGDYTKEEIDAFKDIYADIFEDYFDGYPIKALSYYTEEGEAKRAYINISTRCDHSNADELVTFTIMLTKTDDGELMFHDYRNAKFEYVPDMRLPRKNEAEHYFNYLSDEIFNNPVRTHWFAWRLYTSERIQSIVFGEDNLPDTHHDAMLGKVAAKNHQVLTKMLNEYDYIGCECRKISFGRVPDYSLDLDLQYYFSHSFRECYLQKATLTMAKDGENFTVSFELPIFHDSTVETYSNLLNVEYSDNTPDDFREMFEEIFCK